MGMGWMGEGVVSVKSLQIRQAFSQAITLGLIVTSALIIWKALMCITGSESPVVVVLSESMEPAFQRGDILFLSMSKDPIRAGEIVVFNIDGRAIPIVHRVIKVHELKDSGEDYVLTKGDNNNKDDRAGGYMLMGSSGFSGITSWVELWGKISSTFLSLYILIGALGLLVIMAKD